MDMLIVFGAFFAGMLICFLMSFYHRMIDIRIIRYLNEQIKERDSRIYALSYMRRMGVTQEIDLPPQYVESTPGDPIGFGSRTDADEAEIFANR